MYPTKQNDERRLRSAMAIYATKERKKRNNAWYIYVWMWLTTKLFGFSIVRWLVNMTSPLLLMLLLPHIHDKLSQIIPVKVFPHHHTIHIQLQKRWKKNPNMKKRVRVSDTSHLIWMQLAIENLLLTFINIFKF